MKKFLLGLFCGLILAASSAVYASDGIQALLCPVKLVINSKEEKPDNENATLYYNGHAYVPIRFIAERIGATVGYDGDNNAIYFNVIDLDVLNAKLKIGQSISEVKQLLGDRYTDISNPDEPYKVWRYDIGTVPGYKFEPEEHEAKFDADGLYAGSIKMHVSVRFDENKLVHSTIFYKGADGKIHLHELMENGTTRDAIM